MEKDILFKPFGIAPNKGPAAPAKEAATAPKETTRTGFTSFTGFSAKPLDAAAPVPVAEQVPVETIDEADLPSFLTETIPGPDSPTRMGRRRPR